jgi:protein transport protein SEC23
MLFAGGPATEGPGLVVSNELREPIRSWHDIDRDTVKHYKRATKVSSHQLYHHLSMYDTDSLLQFYEALAKRASANGHVVDLLAGCLDQVGLLEMKSLSNSTNGAIIISDR